MSTRNSCQAPSSRCKSQILPSPAAALSRAAAAAAIPSPRKTLRSRCTFAATSTAAGIRTKAPMAAKKKGESKKAPSISPETGPAAGRSARSRRDQTNSIHTVHTAAAARSRTHRTVRQTAPLPGRGLREGNSLPLSRFLCFIVNLSCKRNAHRTSPVRTSQKHP